MWNTIKRLFSRRPIAAEKLLSHFDRLAGTEPDCVKVSDEGVEPALFSLIYRGFPTPDALTGFTLGLSHFHPHGGGHKELVISMRDVDDKWALACAYTAFQLRDLCPFVCKETIDFREQIARSSKMSAFLVVQPRHISLPDTVVDLGMRQVELVELIPLYEEERAWLNASGDIEKFIKGCPSSLSMDPKRNSLAPN